MNRGPDGPILVTGATGFLGPHVVAAAVAAARSEATFADPEGFPVFAAGRSLDGCPSFCTPRNAAEEVSVDLLDEGVLERLVDACKPAVWIHCAALSRIADCAAQPELARRTNVDVPRGIAELCARRDIRLVHVSTDLVFGGAPSPKGGFREEQPSAPLSVYGQTKAEAETFVLQACPTALVVRLPLLYGDSGARGLGASDSLLDAMQAEQVPPLFVDEFRCPLEVRDAAAALVELACGDASGILHVAGPDRVSRHELGLHILKAMGIEPKDGAAMVCEAGRADAPEPETRPGELCLDSSRARALLECPLHGVTSGTERAMT